MTHFRLKVGNTHSLLRSRDVLFKHFAVTLWIMSLHGSILKLEYVSVVYINKPHIY